MASSIKILDPVQGLIDYTNDIKPYHTKVIEALIEYAGHDTVDVSVFEDFTFTLESVYEFDGVYVCLLGGYGTPYFGDPATILVSSPDVSKTITEYPAMAPNFFIVLGDKTELFDPTVNISLSIISAIEDKIIDVELSGSPSGSFIVDGDQTSDYAIGTIINVVGSVGSPNNDGTYEVASAVYVPVGIGSPQTNATQINVVETITSNSVEGFISIPDPVNTGTFTVISSEYTDSYRTPYTTVFITGISLLPPTFTSVSDPNRRFVSVIDSQPLIYDRILSYSTAMRLYETSSPPLPYYAADEGLVIAEIVNVSATSVSVLGNFQSSNLFVNDEFEVVSSTGNDGKYTITSMLYEYMGSPISDFVTTFGVAAVPDSNIDGNVKLFIPSNVFIVDSGDYTRFFVQGSRVNITTGSHIGQYTTLNSQFINNKTYIRVRETLIDEGTGRLIISTGANYIAVDGDVTPIYGGSPPQQFNIVASLRNDGAYTTVSATYIAGTNTTQIVILEPFDITDVSGEIHEFTSGKITHLPEGFGATEDLCELVPQALSISSIAEDFKLVMGHKFIIDSTHSIGSEIHIQDDEGYVYNILTAGSPPDTLVEIIEAGANSGEYTITSVTPAASPSNITVLTVSTSLVDTGATGSPPSTSGYLLYQNWWQYYVTNIAGSPPNNFIVAGDATADISAGSPPSTIQHIFTNDVYTVNAISFDGTNTTITVNGTIATTKPVGSPPIIVDVTAGSPPFDDWIISI